MGDLCPFFIHIPCGKALRVLLMRLTCGDTYTEVVDKLTGGAAAVNGYIYATFAEAVAAAEAGDTVTLLADVTIDGAAIADEAVDFNGYTVTGTLLGTLELNGGNLVTAEGYKMIGFDADYYKTDDAVVELGATDITIVSGTVTLAQSWWTLEGQTLTIAEDATFVIPADIKLNVLSTVVVNGTAVVDGDANDYYGEARA